MMLHRFTKSALLAVALAVSACTTSGTGSQDDGHTTVPVGSNEGSLSADAAVPSTDGAPATPEATGGCAVTLCAQGTTCFEVGGGRAECVPTPSCDGVTCDKGQHCELTEVQCIRAPCPPQPSCVANPEDDPCAAVRCAAGTHCEAKPVQCIRAPCPAIAECGKNSCGKGQYCCNPSCGICAPMGAACIQQFCGP